MSTEKNIALTLVYHNKEVLVNTFTNEFPDLRELIMAKLNLDFFGECGGVGRCVTCLVSLNSNKAFNQEIREEFACQVAVDNKLANYSIKVVGDRLNPF